MPFDFDMSHNADNLGHAIDEFPAQPHIFNYEGMDVQETVLAIISK
ncbi:MAG: hypothetical protein FWE21_06355 [Defluviitaleaceae bacterium]|nr:hypothetical protein [Defluviitaleaceae bacterium]